ncbi:twitch domain-containing radical SAM protein [Bacteriovorax sp. Seq25_V]|uniref:twitch domain-containing radical SAM protein n=1 Tax=Bacteriovorax sp. Seq25_V TaxID=1201288 RepID=UPI00038A53EA|nr:twitch domain-containing radical SAM protein [Bacteriovorax sp. Seq25_V]EQC47898.1 radical SAM domain protein [Bacteriovorax sp. Seq25_V]
MSDEKNDLYLSTREKLNNISKSFCTAKWNQVTLHLQNGRTHSCHHPPTHHIPSVEIEHNATALHNTKEKKLYRKMMLEGKRPSECNYCWDIEDLPGNQISDRYIKSSDPLINNDDDIERIAKRQWDEDVIPPYMEVSFSNKCNLKCTYCSPVHSTKWVQEIKQEGPYKIFNNREVNSLEYLKSSNQMPFEPSAENEENPYVRAFWQWWPNLKQGLKIFRITGGEPLLDKNTFRILDELIASPIKELEISINTNACASDDLIDKFINKLQIINDKNFVKKISIFTSVDGSGEAAEYGRTGLNYEIWKKNLEKMLIQLPGIQVSIMFTANIFSITTIDSFVREMHELKIKYSSEFQALPIIIDFNILRYPGFLNISLLPVSFYQKLEETLEYIKSFNIDKDNTLKHGFCNFEMIKFKRLMDFLKDGPEITADYNKDVSKADFFLFIDQLDTRRGTNFKKTFPELVEFYNHCESINTELLIKHHSSN